MLKVSLIIPVYNAASHLDRCIKSALAQSETSMELILVDDGSTDGSGDICDRYAEGDKRIKVIHQPNAGVSAARNAGLDAALGDWVAFMDADDEVDEHYLESLLTPVFHTKDCSVLVVQGLCMLHRDGRVERMSLEARDINTQEMHTLFAEQPIYEVGYSCGKLYNRSVIESGRLRFDVSLSYAEDMIFMLGYILHADKVVYLSNAHYYYYETEKSLSSRYAPHESELRCFEQFMKLNQAIAQQFGFEVSQTTRRYAARQLMRSVYAMYANASYSPSILALRTLRAKYGVFIQHEYHPKLLLFKITKILFNHNLFFFHLACQWIFCAKKTSVK